MFEHVHFFSIFHARAKVVSVFLNRADTSTLEIIFSVGVNIDGGYKVFNSDQVQSFSKYC